ncbi:hypothetical protein BsWGS_14869 [Bradybaena similaris]
MGGKSSKQKIKKSKGTKGEQTQNSKGQKESTENGATATGQPSQNETTLEEHGNKDAKKDTDKNESTTTESVVKTSENDTSQPVTTAEPVAVSSEKSPVESQPKDGTSSPQSEKKDESESKVEVSTKEREEEREAESITSQGELELNKAECAENVCLQEVAAEKEESGADVSTAQLEELNKSSQNAEPGEEMESISAPSPHTPDTGAVLSTAADKEETTAEDKTTPAAVPTEVKWEDGGETVLFSGSYDDWQEKITLIKCGDMFTKTLDLPAGEHLCRFNVDDQWVINRNLPVKCDVDGLEKNVLVVQPAT